MHYDFVPIAYRNPLKWPMANASLLSDHQHGILGSVRDTTEPYYPGGPSIVGGNLAGNVYDNANYTWREYGQRVGVGVCLIFLMRRALPQVAQ